MFSYLKNNKGNSFIIWWMQWPPKSTDGFLQRKLKSLIFFEIMLFCWSKVIAGYDNQERLAYFGMSNNIDQENQPGNDDNTDRTKDIGENNYVRCTSCKVRSFFTYRGLNQHLRTCLRKTRDLIVTDSQPPSSSSANFFMTETVIIYKLVHWFATQINGLVAIW